VARDAPPPRLRLPCVRCEYGRTRVSRLRLALSLYARAEAGACMEYRLYVPPVGYESCEIAFGRMCRVREVSICVCLGVCCGVFPLGAGGRLGAEARGEHITERCEPVCSKQLNTKYARCARAGPRGRGPGPGRPGGDWRGRPRREVAYTVRICYIVSLTRDIVGMV
jgi:hypothetical protein